MTSLYPNRHSKRRGSGGLTSMDLRLPPSFDSANSKESILSLEQQQSTTAKDKKVKAESQQLSKRLFEIEDHDDRQLPSTKSLFEIDVEPNELNPKQRADILIRGPENVEGLLAVLLMTLTIEHWTIVRVQTGDDDEDEVSTPLLRADDKRSLKAKSILDRLDQQCEQRITVQVPESMQVGGEKKISLLTDLRLLLLSACDDFVSPRRSLIPLISTFESLIEPNREGVHACNLEEVAEKMEGIGHDVIVMPGVIQAKGRALGAPRRRSAAIIATNDNDRGHRRSLPTGRSSRWQGTREWISTRSRISWAAGSSPNPRQQYEESVNDHASLSNVPIAAEIVTGEEDIEANIRNRLMEEAATASIVMTGAESTELTAANSAKKKRKRMVRLGLFVVVIVIGAVSGFVLGLSTKEDKIDSNETLLGDSSVAPSLLNSAAPSSSPTETPPPTLKIVANRGSIRCSVGPENLSFSKLEVELCRGLAAAVFDDPNQVELFKHPRQNRYKVLDNGTVDVLISTMPQVVTHSLQEPTTGKSFAFSSPYFYGGLVFGGPSEFVECANALDSYFGICRRLVVCAIDSTTHKEFLQLRLPPQNYKIVADLTGVLATGECNVIGADAGVMTESLQLASGDSVPVCDGDCNFAIGSNTFTTEPLAMVTRSKDHEWTTMVETVLQGLLEAERRNITQETASSFPTVEYFGLEFRNMISQAIEGVGNFGEVYERTIGAQVPRTGLNRLRTDTSCEQEGGLILSSISGSFEYAYDPFLDDANKSRFAEILSQRRFNCGVPISADFALFNVEICKAISAAMFGSTDHFETVPYDTESIEAFYRLYAGQVDVVTGVGSSVLPTVGSDLTHFILSKPYFYYPTKDGTTTEAYVLATRATDAQWASFVEMVVEATIYAEELLLSKEEGVLLPENALIADLLRQAFENIVLAVGNYDEIYERTLATPRSGCNRLNLAPHGPQHFPFLVHGT